MEKTQILNIINTKIKEHEAELKQVSQDVLQVHGIKPKNIEEAGKILVLKDKIIFHKAAIMALADLKQEVSKL